ncbi:MAG: tetratricopeptide repeat protein [Candidatus Moraniibacteriota bacterium]
MPEQISKQFDALESILSKKTVFVLLFVIGFLVYSSSFMNNMFWDDYESIINNTYVTSWTYLPKYFTENLTAGSGIANNYWRPILLFSFSVDYKIGGFDPFIYHIQNTFWHILSAFLVFVVGERLFQRRRASFIAALLFLLYPLQTEAVTYVAGRADPMHTAFLLASFLFFLKLESAFSSDEKNGWFLRKENLYSLLFFVLALLVKERAIVLPFLVAMYLGLLYLEALKDRALYIAKILTPYFVIGGVYALLRVTVLKFADTFDFGSTLTFGGASLFTKLLIYLKAIAQYLGLILWPGKLSMERIVTAPTAQDTLLILIGAMIVVASIVGIIISFKKKRTFAFGMLWFWIAFAPSFHVLPIQGILYEHWLYPAFPGLLFIVGLSFDQFLLESKEKIRTACSILFFFLLIALGTRTIVRNLDWQNPIRFYEQTVSAGGTTARVYVNLGMAYHDAKQYDKAEENYKKAIALDETLFQPWMDLGNLYATEKKKELAIDAFEHSIKNNPVYIPAYINLSAIYYNDKEFTLGIETLQPVLEKFPQNVSVLYTTALMHYSLGEKGEARTLLEKALQIDPNDKQSRTLLGVL